MHGPDIPQIEVQNSMARIREAASKTQEAPLQILNKVVDKHHPNIYQFMERLRGEQARTETLIEKLIGGEKPLEVRQKVISTLSLYFPINLYTTFVSMNLRVHI